MNSIRSVFLGVVLCVSVAACGSAALAPAGAEEPVEPSSPAYGEPDSMGLQVAPDEVSSVETNKSTSDPGEAPPQPAPQEAPTAAEPTREVRPPAQPMVDIEARFQVEVRDLSAAARTLREAMLAKGARVSQDSMSRSGENQSAILTFRIAPESAASASEIIERLGVVRQKDVIAKDVSKEYFDTQLRLANLEHTLARYTELLAKTSEVDELLRIESELDRLRGEIEQLKGTLRYLKDRVAMATLIVTLWAPGSMPADVVRPQAVLYPGVRLGWVVDGGHGQPREGFGSLGLSLRFAQRASIDLDLLRGFDEESRDVEAIFATVGVDTYSEFLGNGQRRTLNPYLGMRLGYGDRLPGSEFLAGVTLGLELLKTEVFTLEADLRALGLFGEQTGSRLGLQPTVGANVAF